MGPHPCVIEAIASGTDGDDDFLVLRAWREDLCAVRRRCKKNPIPLAFLKTVSRQVLTALEHVHGHGVVHRDIKLQNILVDPTTMRIALSDFGLATHSDGPSAIAGKCNLDLAPETIRGEGRVSPATDMWAFACMMLHFATGTIVFPSETIRGVSAQLSRLVDILGPPSEADIAALGWGGGSEANMRVPTRGHREQTEDVIERTFGGAEGNRDAVDFIMACLAYDPKNRPTATALLQHAFLRE